MTIDELIDAKTELENRVAEQVHRFEDLTKYHVTDLDVRVIEPGSYAKPSDPRVFVQLKAEI